MTSHSKRFANREAKIEEIRQLDASKIIRSGGTPVTEKQLNAIRVKHPDLFGKYGGPRANCGSELTTREGLKVAENVMRHFHIRFLKWRMEGRIRASLYWEGVEAGLTDEQIGNWQHSNMTLDEAALS